MRLLASARTRTTLFGDLIGFHRPLPHHRPHLRQPHDLRRLPLRSRAWIQHTAALRMARLTWAPRLALRRSTWTSWLVARRHVRRLSSRRTTPGGLWATCGSRRRRGWCRRGRAARSQLGVGPGRAGSLGRANRQVGGRVWFCWRSQSPRWRSWFDSPAQTEAQCTTCYLTGL